MKRDMNKCGVCDKYVGNGSGLCGDHWYKLSISGYPITERKIKALRT